MFSKALFIELASVMSSDFTSIDTTVQVDQGKVWMITDARAFRISNDFFPYENAIGLWINDQVIHHQRSIVVGPLWLPEGQYRIRLRTDDKKEDAPYRTYLSGVEYIIQ